MDDLSIHLLCCSCSNECIVAHDTFRDIIVACIGEWNSHAEKGFLPFPPATRENEWMCHH